MIFIFSVSHPLPLLSDAIAFFFLTGYCSTSYIRSLQIWPPNRDSIAVHFNFFILLRLAIKTKIVEGKKRCRKKIAHQSYVLSKHFVKTVFAKHNNRTTIIRVLCLKSSVYRSSPPQQPLIHQTYLWHYWPLKRPLFCKWLFLRSGIYM